MGLKDKVVLITGAAGEIGRSAVARFCERGARIVAVDIDKEKLQTVVAGREAIAVHCDLTDRQSCAAAVKQALGTYGRIDCLICNAGVVKTGYIDELPPEQFKWLIDINVIGVYNMVKAAIEDIAYGGSIIVTSSRGGKKGVAAFSQYSDSKHALLGFVQSLAYELGERQIRVNAVAPGDLLDSDIWTKDLIINFSKTNNCTIEELTETRRTESPLGRYCYAYDISGAMMFLADEELSCYVNAQCVDVSGGVITW